jgi:hypothetical protein
MRELFKAIVYIVLFQHQIHLSFIFQVYYS